MRERVRHRGQLPAAQGLSVHRSTCIDFIKQHDRVYVVDQNRDAQLLGLMRLELDVELIAKLRSVRYYGGLPLDARTVTEEIDQPGGQMSTTAPPPPKKVNRIGLEVLNYKGSKTTLCAGCGHNSISERIVECFLRAGRRAVPGG